MCELAILWGNANDLGLVWALLGLPLSLIIAQLVDSIIFKEWILYVIDSCWIIVDEDDERTENYGADEFANWDTPSSSPKQEILLC